MLAVCVLDDLDIIIGDHSVTVANTIQMSWREIELAISPHSSHGDGAVRSARTWVRTRLRVIGWSAAQQLARVRPVGLPVDHVLHPGTLWVRERILGGSLDVGLGLRDTAADPEVVQVLDPPLVTYLGISVDAWWDRARAYREEMAQYGIERLARDPVSTLRSVGDCDVPTLLSSRAFRHQIVQVDDSGMRSAAVPTRTHGWLDLGRIDPAFAVAAADAVSEEQRGFTRPLLITRDEVVQVPDGGDHRILDSRGIDR